MPLTSRIGPVQNIKRIINSKAFFEERGYEVNVFSADNIEKTIE